MADKSTTSPDPTWLGITGLEPFDETGLLDHIRKDEWETYGKKFDVSVHDLSYVGKVVEGNALVHYWQLRDLFGRLAYASIGIADEFFVYDYGRWTVVHDRTIYT